MGWVMMSERELQRVEVLTSILTGRTTVCAAAAILAMSRRQVHRLLNAYRHNGATARRHQARGRRSNHMLSDGLRGHRQLGGRPPCEEWLSRARRTG